MVIYDIVNIIGPLFTHFGLVSCLCLKQWPLAFLMTPLDWTMSCHVLIMDDGRGWKHHRGTHKFLCRMDNFSGIYFNYIDINYIYINKKNWLFLYDTVKGVFLIGKKNWSAIMISCIFYRVNRCNFTNNNETAILSCMRERPLQTYPDEETRELMPHGNIDLGQHWLR